jgi:hypothetical protein
MVFLENLLKSATFHTEIIEFKSGHRSQDKSQFLTLLVCSKPFILVICVWLHIWEISHTNWLIKESHI